jgi:hypothetical protein
MRIAYLTTDEVNQDLATQMAAECGVTLVPVTPQAPSPDGQFDAVVYDLDYLPPDQRQQILTDLSSHPVGRRVAVHSYRLADEQTETLCDNGVLVYRRLEPELFLLLQLLADEVRSDARFARDRGAAVSGVVQQG